MKIALSSASLKPGSHSAVMIVIAALALTVGTRSARSDEGMWTYDHFPAAQVAQKFRTSIDSAWLEKIRLSTLRLSNCTASFVSPDGLILTNHHCSEQCLAEISSPQADRIRDGFLARTRGEELRCPTQYADVLVEIQDVTGTVSAATRGKDAMSAGVARKRTLTQLEEACEQGLGEPNDRHCETVKLYEGGQYFLYRYKRYRDVRLVFAPEAAIAAFGGDPDNFQFPRWCLDMSVLRAYEDGQPVHTDHYLKVNWNGPSAGELVFVSGHPGSTERELTVAQLEARRRSIPFWLLRAAELRGRYIQFAQGGMEQARIMADPLNTLENSIKVRRKELDALLDGALMRQKQADESALRRRAHLDGVNDPWEQIRQAEQHYQEIEQPYTFIEAGSAFNSALFRYARTLVRAAAERAKPNDERLREYTDAELQQIHQQISANIPVYPAREKITLSFGLMRMREFLGPDYPLVENLLKESSPEQLAADLVDGSQLADPEVRKTLWDGGRAAINASRDPMVRIALLVDSQARAIRKRYEDEVESPIDAATERIAAARFKVYGTSVYPDATFTLRLNFGTVQGWKEGGDAVPPFTRLARAFDRATGSDPFRIPDSWIRVKDQLDLQTPFNLSTNNDIVGGNSGSPLINAQGELVGLIFDGNIHSISGSYWFNNALNRSIAVHPAIIRAALRQVYGADSLAAELGLR